MKKIFLSLMLLAASAFAETGWVFQPFYSQGSANPAKNVTAGKTGSLYFSTSGNGVFVKTDDFPSTNWLQITGSRQETYFARTCSITSAAGGTAVHCLLAGDVGTSQSAFITAFHGLVNGSTAWATTTSCSIQDTNGTPVSFASIAVAAMTANAYIVPSTSGVTLGTAFSTGTGGTAAAGIDLKCNANGTGSTFVVTIEGYLH